MSWVDGEDEDEEDEEIEDGDVLSLVGIKVVFHALPNKDEHWEIFDEENNLIGTAFDGLSTRQLLEEYASSGTGGMDKAEIKADKEETAQSYGITLPGNWMEILQQHGYSLAQIYEMGVTDIKEALENLT
jgi:hypothetical protein